MKKILLLLIGYFLLANANASISHKDTQKKSLEVAHNRMSEDSIYLTLNNSSSPFIDFTISSYTIRVQAGDSFYGYVPVTTGENNIRVRIGAVGDYYYSDSEGNYGETSSVIISLGLIDISDSYGFQIEDYGTNPEHL